MLRRVLVGLNVNAVRWAGGRAKKAGHAFFQAVFIALQHVCAAKTLLKNRAVQWARAVRIVFNLGRLKHLTESDAHALRDSGRVAHYPHGPSIR